jgi:hypothetical protein
VGISRASLYRYLPETERDGRPGGLRRLMDVDLVEAGRLAGALALIHRSSG